MRVIYEYGAIGAEWREYATSKSWYNIHMKYKAVLFDLDGTLLPMDQDKFVNGYFQFLVKKLMPYGYEPEELIRGIWTGVGAMVANDGSCRNEEAFWNAFSGIYGEEVREHMPIFEEFYAKEFQQAQMFCGFSPFAARAVETVKESGAMAVLATNPLFPEVATLSRIRWAGLSPEDFALHTTYENIGYCKPNPDYYREILRRLDVKADTCLMVGNDVGEDMITRELGMDVYLVTDCLINKTEHSVEEYPHGTLEELVGFLSSEA